MALQARQTTQQRLMLAPNVTLALEVLRMPAMELQAFLRKQMEENPLLETDEVQEVESDASPDEVNGQEERVPEGFDDGWPSPWQNGAAGGQTEDEQESEQRSLEQRLVKPESFHDSLRLQLGCQQLPEEIRRLGEALIQRLDDYGYLDGSLEELADELQAPYAALHAALQVIQRFDPPGVGARDLRECLMIQLAYHGASEGLAYRILKDHFKLFAQHNLSAIAKATARPLQQVEEAFESLKRLNPKPGRVFSGELPPTVIPDLVIVRQEEYFDVELNDQSVPSVTVSRAYYRMLKHPNTPADAKEFLASKFRKASWLIKAIDERNTTLLAIGRCLISLQRDFVEHGPRALKPLTQAQVAALVGRHASTVSRAISGKSIDTPYGVFRLEQLFASAVPQHRDGADGAAKTGAFDHISDATIKSEIRRLIETEDVRRPLSDEALVKQLAQRNIAVARRTIAKYRTNLKILPAHLRKHRL